jgi:hypothetical protein
MILLDMFLVFLPGLLLHRQALDERSHNNCDRATGFQGGAHDFNGRPIPFCEPRYRADADKSLEAQIDG